MKITLDIPDWQANEGGRLTVFHAQELVAFKERGKRWYVKTGRCSRCGKCCETCESLGHEVGKERKPICRHPIDKPFVCALTPLHRSRVHPECTIRFKRV